MKSITVRPCPKVGRGRKDASSIGDMGLGDVRCGKRGCNIQDAGTDVVKNIFKYTDFARVVFSV